MPPLRSAATVALVAAAALLGVLTPQATAAQATRTTSSALPLPLPAAGVEPIVGEGVTIEGPLLNNITLPILR